MNKNYLLIIPALAFYCIIANANGSSEAPHQWRIVESTGLQGNSNGIRWQAMFLDEDLSEKQNSDNPVGNLGVPENFNRRRLVIEVFDKSSNALLRHEEFSAPTQTIQDDPCSITNLTRLDADDGYLMLGFQYDYACGAGVGTMVDYKIDVAKNKSRMVEFNIYSASRDTVWRTNINYKKGLMATSYGKTEEGLGDPALKKTQRGTRPLSGDFLSRCPAPSRGTMPNCGER